MSNHRAAVPITEGFQLKLILLPRRRRTVPLPTPSFAGIWRRLETDSRTKTTS